MGMESKRGLMVPNTLESGEKTELTAMANLSTSTEMSMMVHGRMTRPTGTEHTCMLTVQNTKVTGEMISSMGAALRLGQMEAGTMVSMHSAASMALAPTNGMMALSIRENGRKIRFLVSESIRG
jgi:hypothetical protein